MSSLKEDDNVAEKKTRLIKEAVKTYLGGTPMMRGWPRLVIHFGKAWSFRESGWPVVRGVGI